MRVFSSSKNIICAETRPSPTMLKLLSAKTKEMQIAAVIEKRLRNDCGRMLNLKTYNSCGKPK